MHELTADEHVSIYWAMCERDDVQKLTQQLTDGLIHPLEYADAIKRIGAELGIQ